MKRTKKHNPRMLTATLGPYHALAVAVLAQADEDERAAEKLLKRRPAFKTRKLEYERNCRKNKARNILIGLEYFDKTDREYGRGWWEYVADKFRAELA